MNKMDLSSENFIISPSDSERITKEFNEGLDKLTFNCRNTIHGLTKYASTRTNLAPVIANLLEIRIYKVILIAIAVTLLVCTSCKTPLFVSARFNCKKYWQAVYPALFNKVKTSFFR